MEADVASAVQPAPVALIVASRLRLFCLFACSPPLPGLVLRLWLWMFAFRMGRARRRGRLTIA